MSDPVDRKRKACELDSSKDERVGEKAAEGEVEKGSEVDDRTDSPLLAGVNESGVRLLPDAYSKEKALADGMLVKYDREKTYGYCAEGNCPKCFRIGVHCCQCDACNRTIVVFTLPKSTGYYVNPELVAYMGSDSVSDPKTTACTRPSESPIASPSLTWDVPWCAFRKTGREEYHSSRVNKSYWDTLGRGRFEDIGVEARSYFMEVLRKCGSKK